MVAAVLLTIAMTTGGLMLSYEADLPTSAVTILLTASVFTLAHLIKRR